MIAILENFQEADGSIGVPRVLWEFGAPRRMGSVALGRSRTIQLRANA